ncbi:hypothetical protein T552_02312 [Pneumocystis carinii B80]|uniref:Ubiquitin carboxyl-terminal hydrolase n=1 Tax=Pneumocystis carinii (strain B80) TaxID=1408658 RepID=A0A0W4ZG27_PNEC8|nr:hypothetical protein T552_02312 [Pneumocystis carinii B80]KTW27328.1 hypothetical protein T552_02312 [Pneumocystis carinii B80]
MMESWVPLECNPFILTQYLWELGISKDLEIYDIFTLDDEEMLRFIPRPVFALLFVFPVKESDENCSSIETKEILIKNQENIIWFKQTVRNSCGAIALLHAATNGDARNFILPNTLLANILEKIEYLDPSSLSNMIEFSQLKTIHEKFASQGETTAPDALEDTSLHYVCFVKSSVNGHLYELDGRNPLGPIDHGFLNNSDILGDQSIQIIKSYINKREKEIRFSLCALAYKIQ